MLTKKIKRLVIASFIGGCIAPFALQAQEQPSVGTKAERFLLRNEYANAIKVLEKTANKANASTLNMERLAESYMYLNNYATAELWYAKILNRKDYKEQSLLNYAEVLKQNTKYAEAKQQYQKYASKYGESPEINLAIAGADSAMQWMKSPSPHKIKNEERINTDRAEFGAFPTKSYGVLYTAEPGIYAARKSGMTGESYLRIFTADPSRLEAGLDNGLMRKEEFNAMKYHVGPVMTNAKEDVMYVTRTYPGKQPERYRSGGKSIKRNNLELIIYKLENGLWKEIDFPYNNVQEYSLGHAALSMDEKTLYFASDMPGGLGCVDIWYSELQSDGSWGRPINAGPSVNSTGDELFPFVYEDELYFSSDGRAGMGGLDIFHAKGMKGNFSEAKNMGFPINSAGDDFAFVYTKSSERESQGYLSSNRVGGKGNDDIYSFTYSKPQIRILLEGLTLNKKTQALLAGADVTLSTAEGKVIGKVQSDGNALFTFPIVENQRYKFVGEKNDFTADSLLIGPFTALNDTLIRIKLELEPIPAYTVGQKFVLENIHYDFDKHDIRPDAALILDDLVQTLKDHPTLRIELSSHTDSRGNDNYNMRLSQLRAQSAVTYIISRGIDKSRLVAKGYGESRLINHCGNGVQCSDDEHQANRRTEVEVLAY